MWSQFRVGLGEGDSDFTEDSVMQEFQCGPEVIDSG